MKAKIIYILAGAFVFASFLTSLSFVYAASCSLTGGSFADQSTSSSAVSTSAVTVSPGQPFYVKVVGNNCVGQSITLKISGKAGLGNFNIKSIALKFPAGAISISETVTISAGEIATRTTDTTATFEASTNDGTSKVTSSNTLIIKPNSAGTCKLSSAKWSWKFSAHPIIGSPLHMIVDGVGCSGYGVSFKIYSSEIFANREVAEVTGKFDSAGTKVDAVWVADTSKDTRIISSRIGDYHFYFIASADQSKVTSNTTLIPTNSQQGCLNCNAALAPSSPECADGTKIDRGIGGDAPSACKDHIGDALTDKSGTCTTCGGGGTGSGGGTSGGGGGTTVPGTNTQTYSFNITNPIQGGPNTLSDVIDIVTKWLLNISIPLAVIFILWAGFLMLTAGPEPAKFDKGKKILVNVVIGLAVIFIGRGFITLIYSIIELGGSDTSTTNNQPYDPGSPAGPALAGLGESCANSKVCSSGLVCNKICQRPKGNEIGEACNKTANPSNCKSQACSTIGTSQDGTCVDNTKSTSDGSSYKDLLTIMPDNISGGKVGEPYSMDLVVKNATDLNQVYNWQLIANSAGLPPGLTYKISSKATNYSGISGIPNKAGTYKFEMQGMDIPNKLIGRLKITIVITP